MAAQERCPDGAEKGGPSELGLGTGACGSCGREAPDARGGGRARLLLKPGGQGTSSPSQEGERGLREACAPRSSPGTCPVRKRGFPL